MQLTQHLTNADACPQFVVSKIVKQRDGRTDKIPCNAQGITASHKDPENWLTLNHAQTCVAVLGPDHYVGFSITNDSGYFFLDIDGCIKDGVPTPLGHTLRKMFPNSYFEISQSGTGYHIISRYTGIAPPHKNKNAALHIELYTHDRFVLLTGTQAEGDWNTDATEAFHALISEYFPQQINDAIADLAQDVENLQEDDQVVLACQEKSYSQKVFGGGRKGASFDDLFNADETVLAITYPTTSEGKLYNASGADQALANMIACQTIDKDQIVRIMWRSKLARDKWNRGTYLLDTVNKALASRQLLQLSQQKHNSDPANTSQPLVDEMPQEYQGCYFVIADRGTYSMRHAALLTKDVFNMCFTIPYMKGNPYDIFKTYASITGRIVRYQGFKPELPHGEITEREGDTFVNTYKPIKVKMKEGNVEPFLNLLRINFPVERDQRIILSYLAALVQNPGFKAMWCPVLQGDEGCGKSFLMDFAAHAVGEKYTYRARGRDFESQFNGNFFAKLILLIEDPILKEGKLEERLKQLVTQKLLAFEGKGVDAKMGDHCANIIVTLNDFENFKKQEGSRRYSVFKSAIQSKEDRKNAGLTDAYFFELARWRDTEGYETVSHMLHNYIPDPEFDFTKACCTAPHTSTTDAAIQDCKSSAELLIQEAIDSGRVGFRGDMISGTMLTRLFQEQARSGISLPDNQRSKVLKSLGYILHTQLAKGRASRAVNPDGNQPTLFVKMGHPTLQMINKEDIMQAYENAQK